MGQLPGGLAGPVVLVEVTARGQRLEPGVERKALVEWRVQAQCVAGQLFGEAGRVPGSKLRKDLQQLCGW